MNKINFNLLNDEDLSEAQILLTMQSYNRHAKKYAKLWEWNPKTIKEIKKYNIKPFVRFVPKASKVLLIGSRSGRDYSLLSDAGYICIGVEPSYGLLSEFASRVPNGLYMRLDFETLPFMPKSFDAIYADALTHLPKKKINAVLRDFRIFLKPKGYMYLSLKIGRVNVFFINDAGGKRYMTVYKKSEVLRMVKEVGFKVLWSEMSEHTEPSLPRWFSLILQKK